MYGYGQSDARGYVNARAAREASVRTRWAEYDAALAAEIAADAARMRALYRAFHAPTRPDESWVPEEPSTDHLGRPVGRGFGGVFDAEYDIGQ